MRWEPRFCAALCCLACLGSLWTLWIWKFQRDDDLVGSLNIEADETLTQELLSLVGHEQQWPKGDEVDAPNEHLWSQWLACRRPNLHAVLRENRSRSAVRAVHVKVMEWLVRHHHDHPRLPDLKASVSARLLRLGLIKHGAQWSEVLNEEVRSVPVMDPVKETIPWEGVSNALRWLEGNFTDVVLPAFRHAVESSRFREHPEGIHLTGWWETAYISEGSKCRVKVFPKMCKLLQAIEVAWPKRRHEEAVLESRFARLHPGTFVVEHTADTNQRIKIHCGIENPSNVTMAIAEMELSWKEGRCYLVDDSYAHQIRSKDSDAIRTILELKVIHPDLAWADMLDEDGTLIPQFQEVKNEF